MSTKLTLDAESLVVARRYRVVYRMPGYQAREMVATFVGVGLLGTTHWECPSPAKLPVDWIREIWETSRPIQPPAMYKGEKRVY